MCTQRTNADQPLKALNVAVKGLETDTQEPVTVN
jgi:hypothetical protein